MTLRAVANQKGGVGKTTTTVTLAGLMREYDRRQLLVDLDPHASLTSYLVQDPEAISSDGYVLFEQAAAGRFPDPGLHVMSVRRVGLDLLPASPALATVERRFGNCPGMGKVIARALAKLATEYDDIWIDCPPTLGVLMVNALAACDQLIIPVQTEFLALKGLERMFASLALIERSRGLSMPRLVVPTLFDRRTRASLDALQALRQGYRDYLWEEPVPVDTRFRYASEQGRPLSQLCPNSRGVVVYRHLAEHLLADDTAKVMAS